jgi:hypothetical protein
MDFDFWLRLIAHTRNIVRVPEVLAFYRWHQGGQISSGVGRQALDAYAVRHDFARAHPELLTHLTRPTRRALIEGELLRAGYNAYWKRDLGAAQRLFKASLVRGGWTLRDLYYLFPAGLLPHGVYCRLVNWADRRRGQAA